MRMHGIGRAYGPTGGYSANSKKAGSDSVWQAGRIKSIRFIYKQMICFTPEETARDCLFISNMPKNPQKRILL